MTTRYKSDYNFYSYKDERFTFKGAWEDSGDAMISMEDSAVMYWQGIATDFLLVCVNHDWSGICQIKCHDKIITADNYSPYPYRKAIPIVENAKPEIINIEVSVKDKNLQSNANQIVVAGFLVNKSEPKFYSYEDQRLNFEGAWEKGDDNTMIGKDKTSILKYQGVTKDFFLSCISHNWSGICQIKCNGEKMAFDNYADVSCQKIIPIAQKSEPEMLDIEISVVGKNEKSYADQFILRGFLTSDLQENEREESIVRQFPNTIDSANKPLVNKVKQHKIHELIYQIFNQDVDINSMYQERRNIYLREWEKVASYIKKGSKILDLGSGYHFDSLLKLFAENQWDYYYLDKNINLVECNKETGMSLNTVSPENFICSDTITNLDVDSYFDGIVSFFYLNQLHKIDTVLEKIKKILKNQGFIFLFTLFGFNVENEEDLYFFSEDNWKDIIQEHGFDLISCELNNKLLLSSGGRGLSIIATIDK